MRSVKVAMRKGPDGKPLSMGFGFVECSSEDTAKAVLKQLQVSHHSAQSPTRISLESVPPPMSNKKQGSSVGVVLQHVHIVIAIFTSKCFCDRLQGTARFPKQHSAVC